MPSARKKPPNRITGAEYGRRIGVTASGITRLFNKGLPFVAGTDARGRSSKLVDPVEADRWRAKNLKLKVDGAGRVRGLVKSASGGSSKGAAGSAKDREVDETAARIQASKARIQEIDERKAEIGLLKLERVLVDRRAAMELVDTFVDAVAAVIDRMPADAATILAAAAGCTEHEAYRALQGVAARMRDDLARVADVQARQARSIGQGGALDESGEQDQAA